MSFVDDRFESFMEFQRNIKVNEYNNAKYKKTKFIPINIKWMEDNIYAWKQLSRAEEIMKSNEYIELVKLII